jgi:predicted PhzF superfamily epimerase YddE/YHI9
MVSGHATLAIAYVILNYIEKQGDTVQFDTMSGVLKVNKKGELYEMDLPSVPSEEMPITEQMIVKMAGKAGLYSIADLHIGY